MQRFIDVQSVSSFATDKMKKNNLFTTERLFCDVYCFEPGQAQAAHAHAGSDKVYYVIEGNGRIRVDAEDLAVGPGTAVLAPAGSSHAVTAGDGRLRVLVLMAPKPG
jgi:quercetin dioxygenase-like cupin family protein